MGPGRRLDQGRRVPRLRGREPPCLLLAAPPLPTHTFRECRRHLRRTRAPESLPVPGRAVRAARRGAARRGGRGAFKARVRPASAGAGRRAGPRRGGRAASPAVSSAQNRGAGGCEAGGRTGPRERAPADLASLPEPGGDRGGAAGLAARGPLERRRRRRRDRSGAIRAAATRRGLRAPGTGRAPGRGAPGKMPAGSGVLLLLLALSGALRVSCRLPPWRLEARAARSRPRSRRGALTPGAALPGFPGPRSGPSRRAPLHPAGSRTPRSRCGWQGRGDAGAAGSGGASGEGVRVGGRRTRGALPGAGPAERLSRPGSAAAAPSPAGGAGAPSTAREPRASGVAERAQPGWGCGCGDPAAAVRGPGCWDTRSGRPYRGLRTRGAAWVFVFGVPTRTVAAGGRRMSTAGPPRPRVPAARAGAGVRRGPRESREPGGRGRGCSPERGPALACLPCSPRTGPQPSPAPAGGRVQGRCAGCAGGASGGGGSGGRGSCRNPLSWPIGLAAPSGRRGVTSEINRRPGQAAGRLRARGELGARRGRLQTFAVCASPELISVLLRARGRSRGAQLFPRNDSVSPPSPGASG